MNYLVQKFFKDLSDDESLNYLVISSIRLGLTKKRLKKDFKDILKSYWKHEDLGDLNVLDCYLGIDVYCLFDDINKRHYIILKDNNFIFPETCFESDI